MSLALIKPSEEYIEEIRSFKQEFIDNNVGFYGTSALDKYDDLTAWITFNREMENHDYAESLGYVEAEQFMLVNEGDTRILGMINFRHFLNQSLENTGGHIGYSIRPSEWRKGYGKAMLSLCLDKCHSYGLKKVLITCDADNIGSRKTIISNGGIFYGKVSTETGYVERYWVSGGDIRIRKAEIDDAAKIAEIICQSWKVAYSDFLPSETIKIHTNIANRTEKFKSILSADNTWNIHLAVINKNACGTISFGKNRESDCGEIYFCYAKPEVWGIGVGYKMMEFALEKLKQQGFHEVILYVFEENKLARKSYERQGFSTDGDVIYGNHGAPEVRYRRDI